MMSVTVEIVLGHFFRRALGLGYNLQFVEFSECRMFLLHHWLLKRNDQK